MEEITIQKDTKNQILDIAEDLIHSKGYHAFSYKDISVILGIKNASIHYHFPNKENLGEAIIQRAIRKVLKWKKKVESKGQTASLDLKDYMALYIHYLENRQKVGLIGTLGSTYFAIPAAMQISAKEISQVMYQWVEEILQKGLENKEFDFSGEKNVKALQIVATLEGALQLARLTNNQHFYQIIENIKNDLKINNS